MPRKTDGLRYIMRLSEPMSRNICHGVPLAPRINCELSGCSHGRRCLICTEKSHLSFTAESLYITSPCPEREREREKRTKKEKKRTRNVINLSAKRPRTSLALLRISQMRPWFSSGIPWRYQHRLSLLSRVICPNLSILDMLDASKTKETPVLLRIQEESWVTTPRDFYSILFNFYILNFIFRIVLYYMHAFF